eukprot:496805_1
MINLNKHTISANIKDRYGITTYAFDFENSDGNTSTELRFEITIDPNAFISRFEANIDGVLFIGQTKEKQTAAKEYDAAKTKDENAILISQPHNEIANVFQIKTNIDAKSKVSLTIQIEQYLQKTFTFNQLNIQILRDFSIYNIEPHFDHIAFQLTVEDESSIYDVVLPLTNTQDVIVDSHTINNSSKRCDITGRIGSDLNSIKCNELILKYKIKGEQNESHVLLDRNCNTFCHIISDAIAHSMAICDEEEGVNTSRIPRRVVFVLDKSGSMSGLKWTNTIRATVMGLEQLRVGCDRFGVILFDDEIEMLFDQGNGMALARDDTVSHAIDMLQKKDIGGSTDINRALLKSIEMIKSDIVSCDNELFINHIMVITDGEPNSGETNTKQIIINVKNANDLSTIDEYNDKISMFSFGVGQDGNHSQWIGDLNHSFLKLLSLNNNGFYKRIKTSFADTSLAQYFGSLSHTKMSNITVQYKNKNVTDLTETKFHALYDGSDLIICGKWNCDEDAKDDYIEVIVSGITGTGGKAIHVSKEIRVDIESVSASKIERIWAYLKLQQMAKRKLLHDDMIQKDEDEDALPLSLALKYKFVTPWTSMIVVKEKDQSNATQIEPHPSEKHAQQQSSVKHRSVNPRYSAERVIGSGSFGGVYKAVQIQTGQTVAIKKVREDRRYKHRELQIMKVVKHPNIVTLLDCFYTKIQRDIYLNLVMEYIPQTLYVTIRNHAKAGQCVPFALIKVYTYQICRALAYCHQRKICHRDVKPQNLLLDPDSHVLKLCDFGSSKRLKDDAPNVSYICSRYYRAPELIFESSYYKTSIDLWSLGCVIGELFLGTPLFQGDKSVDQLVEIIKVLGTPTKEEIMAMNREYTQTEFPVVKTLPWKVVFCGVNYKNKAVPLDGIDLISKLLIFTPHLRLNGFDALSHPYFDELRQPNYKLPSGKRSPPLFNFTDDEIKYAKAKDSQCTLVPKCLWNKYNIN